MFLYEHVCSKCYNPSITVHKSTVGLKPQLRRSAKRKQWPLPKNKCGRVKPHQEQRSTQVKTTLKHSSSLNKAEALNERREFTGRGYYHCAISNTLAPNTCFLAELISIAANMENRTGGFLWQEWKKTKKHYHIIMTNNVCFLALMVMPDCWPSLMTMFSSFLEQSAQFLMFISASDFTSYLQGP